MSIKAASSLLHHYNYTQSSRSITYFFITDNNNKIQHLLPGLEFRSGAWKEDFAGKKWGLLWTLNKNNRPKITTSEIGYKHKMVKVMTKTGEMVMAIEFDSKYNCPY